MDEETVEGLLEQLALSGGGELSYSEFVAAALDTQKHLTAQLLTTIFGPSLFFHRPCIAPLC